MLQPLLAKFRAVLVPELNLGQIYREVLRVNQGETKVMPLHRIDGNLITPEEIVQRLVKL